MYLAMVIMALVLLPYALLSRRTAMRSVCAYCRWVRFSARWIVGIRSEIRGSVPDPPVIICSKHQSFFDILILCSVLPDARFVMKRELRLVPIVGYFARRIGCIAIDRGKGSEAVSKLRAAAMTPAVQSGQLVIFPQGTRVTPGEIKPYRIGAAILYQAAQLPCVPVATNVGVLWPRRSIMRRPGVAVVEFLAPIAPGLSVTDLTARLTREVETASNRLIDEAERYPASP